MRRWAFLLAGVLAFAGAAWFVRSSALLGGDPWDPLTLRSWVAASGFWGPFLYLAVATLMPLFAPYPVGLTWVAGALFGWSYGGLLIAASGLGAALVGYAVGQALGGGLWETPAGRERAESRVGRLLAATGSAPVGWHTVAFLRVVVPWNFVSYWAGATRLPLVVYLSGTCVALLPVSFGYAFVSAAFVEGQGREFALAVPVALAMIFGPIWVLERRRRSGTCLED